MAGHKKDKTPQACVLRRHRMAKELDIIWQIVCQVTETNYRPENPTRSREQVWVRKLFYWLAYDTDMFTYKDLAEYTGKANHTTVMHHVAEISALCEINPLGKPYDPEIYKTVGMCQRELADLMDIQNQSTTYSRRSKPYEWQAAGYL